MEMSVKWNKAEHLFSFKQRWQKHHAEIAKHRSKANFFLWNWYVSLLRFCWKDLYKHLHQLECVIARELVWMFSISFASLAVSNSYFAKLHPRNYFFFWSLLSCFHTTCCASKYLGISHSSCVWVSWTYVWFFLLEAVSFMWAGYNLK